VLIFEHDGGAKGRLGDLIRSATMRSFKWLLEFTTDGRLLLIQDTPICLESRMAEMPPLSETAK
jgi:hypothetical protein